MIFKLQALRSPRLQTARNHKPFTKSIHTNRGIYTLNRAATSVHKLSHKHSNLRLTVE